MELPRPRVGPALARLLIMVLSALACASGGTRARNESDRTVITAAQLETVRAENAYDAVLALRANWLQERGPDSINNPTHVSILLDDLELGGPELLRTISIRSIELIRHLDGVEATARYGVGHGGVAIVVVTASGSRSRGTPTTP